MRKEKTKQKKIYYLRHMDLEKDLIYIDKLCFKAKLMLFEYMYANDDFTLYEVFEGTYNELVALTPIEQILKVAFMIYDIDVNSEKGIEMVSQMRMQENIICDNKVYFVDFIIDGYEKLKNNNKLFEYDYYKLKNPLIIECDGFDYHSNKKQMSYDYERENNLKLAGYDIMRFTGSQIYKEPLRCVEQIVKYIKQNSRRIK